MTSRGEIRLLLVDDDEGLRSVLVEELRRQGIAADGAPDAESALEAAASRVYDVAIVDLNLPGMPGEQLIRELRERSPQTETIVLTGHGSIDAAVRTLKDGAYDFLTKPCNLDELEAVIRKAAEKRDLVRRNRMLQRELARQDRFSGFVGSSEALAEVLGIIEKVAATDTTVLIQGESGVGKELAARAIHRASARADEPFVVVDCTSLQESLLLSELFGHERGAFSGAVTRKQGLFEVAHGGTVFLDEIGELSLPLQSRILRVLDRGTFRHVGGVHDIKVDVRLICATNRDLRAMVAEGSFRRDLYYRINVVSFTLPPLRDRPEDIPLLAEHFARTLPVAPAHPVTISEEAMARLRAYHWPGNVRELQNVIERALILADGDRIEVKDLPAELRDGPAASGGDLLADTPTLAELEKRYIRRLLERFGGHRAKVAAALGISERNL
ncbi:MAG: sigma-54-dependent Fis family transcriptional regulator [Acidobacteria bacterium]|nr:MAG: sigma-54-dependent Fis family transcriptional regulator [Acidobacteriota bacterium]